MANVAKPLTVDDERHGTTAGVSAHRKQGIPMCDPCSEAGATYQRERRKTGNTGYRGPLSGIHAASKDTCVNGHDLTNPSNVYLRRRKSRRGADFDTTKRQCKPCALSDSKSRWAAGKKPNPPQGRITTELITDLWNEIAKENA